MPLIERPPAAVKRRLPERVRQRLLVAARHVHGLQREQLAGQAVERDVDEDRQLLAATGVDLEAVYAVRSEVNQQLGDEEAEDADGGNNRHGSAGESLDADIICELGVCCRSTVG